MKRTIAAVALVLAILAVGYWGMAGWWQEKRELSALQSEYESARELQQALLEEKLGHALPISYEDWLKDCHYEKLDAKLTRWLYQQERGFVESLKDVTLEEIAHQRIDEFTTTLKKYIL